MRAAFGVVSLLVVLAIVGLLAKKSLTSLAPSVEGGIESVVTSPATAKQQVQAYEGDLKRALDAAAQTRASEAAN